MSGLMIFNAHPRLYWGQAGANHDYAWLEIGATRETGFLRVGSLRVETTGVLGRWTDRRGVERTWAFPGWATIPTRYSLADGRRWPLSFAWLGSEEHTHELTSLLRNSYAVFSLQNKNQLLMPQ